jgi:peptidyl-prolyl cis-trans isomerase D
MAGSTGKTLVWILMALLVLGLGGFGVANFSGSARSIGSVGDKDISSSAYHRALQDEIRSAQKQTGKALPFSTARDMNLDQIALARLIATTALDNEAARQGISVGDKNLRDQLLDIKGFQGLDGKFDREAYKFYLSRSGQSEREFEDGIREELARGLLQSAVLTGVPPGHIYADTLVNYLAERRDFTWARLSEDDLDAPLPTPDEAALKAFHDAHKAEFTLPERKRITYTWLTPDMILDKVDVDEAALKQQYEDRADEFNTPERRLVERLGFPDEKTAEAAKVSIEKGEKTFEDIVKDRGLELSDTDMGDVEKKELGKAGNAVFSAQTGQVIGPFTTDIGPALFRVNGVLAAQKQSFEEARKTLHEELAQGSARRELDQMRDDIDDLLASGATLEDVAKETDMQLAHVDWTKDSSEGAAGYAAFQEEAAKLTTNDFPAVIALDDGGLLAMRLDEVLPPKLQPLDQVRDDVVTAWEEDTLTSRLVAKAEALLPKIDPTTDMASLGLTVTQEKDITRQGFITGTTADFLPAVFKMAVGESRVLPMPGGAEIVRLDAIHKPDDTDKDVTALRDALEQQAASARAQDLFQYYINDVQGRAGLKLDQNAINAINSSFQ